MENDSYFYLIARLLAKMTQGQYWMLGSAILTATKKEKTQDCMLWVNCSSQLYGWDLCLRKGYAE